MGKITVIGTGWTRGQLTLDAVAALTGGARVLLHTRRCGCAEWLQEKGIAFESLDDLYEQYDDFDAHADAAAQAVLDAAAADDVVYGVFDVRDVSAARLAARASVEIIPGPPAEGALLALAEGEARCAAASEWEDFHPSARENCFIRELDGQALAGEVKLRLMEVYPEESDVWLLREGRAPERLPLYALDRAEGLDHRACVLVPAQKDIHHLERYDCVHLVELIRFLCSPQGCPWDRVQTHVSLRSSILEEAYEVIDAIDEGDPDHLYDELGDMLLQVVIQAEIGRKHGEFDFSDVTTAICQKMIRRHTHVFGLDRAGDAEEVLGLWDKNKMAERGQQTRTEALRDVTKSLPATLRASKVLKRASEAGVKDESAPEPLDAEAYGAALFHQVDAARRAGVDPELALNAATDRFIERFARLEDELTAAGETFDSLSPERLRNYWDLVKL